MRKAASLEMYPDIMCRTIHCADIAIAANDLPLHEYCFDNRAMLTYIYLQSKPVPVDLLQWDSPLSA
jgi:hypothetical protein